MTGIRTPIATVKIEHANHYTIGPQELLFKINQDSVPTNGTGLDVKEHDQYLIKLDGSGHLSLRNCRFLRQYTLPSLSFKQPSYEMDLAVTSFQMPAPMSDEIKPTTNVGVPQNKHDHFLASYPSSPGHTTDGTSETNFPMTSPTDTIDDNDGDSLPNSPSKPLELPLPGPSVLPKSPMKSTADFNAPAGERPQRIRNPPQKYVPETGN